MAGSGRRQGRRAADGALIAALASGATVADAAKRAGVAERTVYRRLADPAFVGQVDGARRAALVGAVGVLADGMIEAAQTLRALLTTESAFARLGAARVILEYGAKGVEQIDLVRRIEALEAAAAAQAL